MMSNQLRAICFIFLIIVAALYVYTGNQEEHYNATAPSQIAYMLADIDSWEESSLRDHLSQEAKDVITAEQLSNVFQYPKKKIYHR